MKFKTRKKVVIGFILAISLIAGVSTLTYISVKNLLDSVDTLSAPNERLMEYNQLLSDIYKLDQIGFPMENMVPDSLDYLAKIENRLLTLEENSQDPIEAYKLSGIRYNMQELIEVQMNLSEVKASLMTRDFSKEALDNIERRIERQKEQRSLQNIDRAYSRLNPGRGTPDTLPLPHSLIKPSLEPSGITLSERKEMEAFIAYIENNLNEEATSTPDNISVADSVLTALKINLLALTNEERILRTRLANLEKQLTRKNRELIIYIQDIISSLQQEAVQASQDENNAAYDLTYQLSILLAFLTFLGILGSGAFIFSIIKEINKTEHYHLQLEEAKRKSDNLARTKQEFLANMSHEIRNPLHVIQGYHDVLKKTPLSPEQREYLNMSSFASDTLLGVVNDILDFSKLEAGKISISEVPFNPKTLFIKTRDFFKNQAAEKNLRLALTLDLPSQKWLLGDELRIRQILNNLLSNAIKFTEQGEVTLKAVYQEGSLCIEVKDTGLGMSPDVQETIFGEFNQGDGTITRKYGGTGLGLTIVKKLAEIMNGSLGLVSQVGVGTTIDIRLPMDTVEPAKENSLPPVGTYSLQHLRILLVDDDPIVLKFTEHLLTALGASVSGHLGGKELLENFEEKAYDLAMFDIQMPEVSGYDALRWIKRKPAYKTLPILALTANVYAKEKERLDEVGFSGLILKPFKEQELITQVAKYLNLKDTSRQAVTPDSAYSTRQTALYDLTEIAEFCMGDEELLRELVTDFCTHTRADVLKLYEAFQSENTSRLREIAHQLASRLSQFKIGTGARARYLEDQLKTGNTEDLSGIVEEIKGKTEKVLDQMIEDFQLGLAESVK